MALHNNLPWSGQVPFCLSYCRPGKIAKNTLWRDKFFQLRSGLLRVWNLRRAASGFVDHIKQLILWLICYSINIFSLYKKASKILKQNLSKWKSHMMNETISEVEVFGIVFWLRFQFHSAFKIENQDIMDSIYVCFCENILGLFRYVWFCGYLFIWKHCKFYFGGHADDFRWVDDSVCSDLIYDD